MILTPDTDIYICTKSAIIMGVKINKEEFLRRAKEVHGDRYDYSNLDYHKLNEKGIIICKDHGEFSQNLLIHLHAARGCPECGGSVKRTRETFEIAARKIHGDKYDYSKVLYKNNKIKVTLTCRACVKDFEIRPDAHMNGKGCSICGYKVAAKKRSDSPDKFISDARRIHGDRYNYSSINYVGAHHKLDIICAKHGVFKQIPANHLRGVGCPKCRLSKGENTIMNVLNDINIHYESEKSFEDCINPYTNSKLYFDFHLPDHNICIEYDGEQHFMSTEFFAGEAGLLATKERDLIKSRYCKDNNIFLYRIMYLDRDNIDYILRKLLL